MSLRNKMRCITGILSTFALGLGLPLKAQFSGPNASAYNPTNGKYYITNLYGKNVISLDAAGNKATFITGLNQPNNILYADLPVMSGFLILDSNEIKAYDDQGTFFASFSTSGALKLQDAVYDTAIKALFVSDVDRGVIYKTTFGGPPFYIPTTTIFSTPYRRPSAMVVQKAKNRILYVEDTLGGNLMAMDMDSGTVSLVKTLNLDHLVGLAEDGQGNLYLSSQGAQAIFQLNKYYAGTPKKLYNEPKPGDLLVNIPKDRWVYTCIACGTVFNPPLHIFGPGLEVSGCKTDSFTCYRNYLQKNIGTFDVGNKFIMELSNASGSFASPTFISEYTDTLIPDSMLGQIPSNIGSGNYKLRWRSTKPSATGSQEVFTIWADPIFSIAVSDTVQGCLNSVIELGKGNGPQNTYAWRPSTEFDTADKGQVKHKITKAFQIYLDVMSDMGCKASDSAFVLPVNIPNAGAMADTLNVCKGSAVLLGAKAQAGLNYSWSPGTELNDSTMSQPTFIGTENKKFSLKITAEGGCTGADSQYIIIKALPEFQLLKDSVVICNSKSFLNSVITQIQKYTCYWIGPKGDTSIGESKGFVSEIGTTQVVLKDLETGCVAEKTTVFNKYPLTTVQISASNYRLSASKWINQRKWYRNDTLIALDSIELPILKSGFYRLCGLDSNGCDVCSQIQNFMANSQVFTPVENCRLSPNPAQKYLQLSCTENHPAMWQVFDIQGRACLQGKTHEIDISGLKNGIYIFVNANKMRTTFVKNTQ